MLNRPVWIAALMLIVGLAAGAAGTYRWTSKACPAASTPQRATITLAQDACCPTDAKEGEHSEKADEHGHEGEGHLELTPEAVRRFGVETAEAKGGTIEQRLELPGEIVLNADRVAHIVPRVAGMVREVHKTSGDRVQAGEVLAVLDSRELAEAKAADLTAEARLKLAETNLKRVEGLWQQKITPERQYQEAAQAVEEARIVHRETMARLHALGLSHDEVTAISQAEQAAFARYEIKAPFAGTIIERHATLGEVHDTSSSMFVLADLSTVWVEVAIYAQDLARVKTGTRLRIAGPDAGKPAEGEVFYVSPTLREATRTGLARASLANENGRWRPGMFVMPQIVTGSQPADVVVAAEAVQKIGGEAVVFVAEGDGFERRDVEPGGSDGTVTQILSGLKAGDRYVSKGAFILKAELSKGAGGHEH